MRNLALIAAITATLALSGCGKGESQKASGTSDAVEVQQGTISDDMIILDQIATDGTAVDHSVPADSRPKPAAKVEQPADSDTADSSASEASSPAPATPPSSGANANSAATTPAAP